VGAPDPPRPLGPEDKDDASRLRAAQAAAGAASQAAFRAEQENLVLRKALQEAVGRADGRYRAGERESVCVCLMCLRESNGERDRERKSVRRTSSCARRCRMRGGPMGDTEQVRS